MSLQSMCSILIALASTCPALGQANFSFRNFGIGLNAPVFDSQGVPLAGTNYLAELWGAATPDSLKPLVLLNKGGLRRIKPFWTNGYVIPPGASALVVTTYPLVQNGFFSRPPPLFRSTSGL